MVISAMRVLITWKQADIEPHAHGINIKPLQSVDNPAYQDQKRNGTGSTCAVITTTRGGKNMIKFYNGRKLVRTVITNNTARVINEMLMQSEIEWTRYKIA